MQRDGPPCDTFTAYVDVQHVNSTVRRVEHFGIVAVLPGVSTFSLCHSLLFVCLFHSLGLHSSQSDGVHYALLVLFLFAPIERIQKADFEYTIHTPTNIYR